MHAYLIIGHNQELVDLEIDRIVKQISALKYPFELAKVADIKKLEDFTKLSLDEITAVIVSNFEEATTETQNAFLKSLEEPQEKLNYIISAKSKHSLLPTIISRCELIELKGITAKRESKSNLSVEKYLDSSVGQKLDYVSKIKDRKVAIEFVESLIQAAHQKLKQDPQLAQELEHSLTTLAALKANGNVSLQLTSLVISATS